MSSSSGALWNGSPSYIGITSYSENLPRCAGASASRQYWRISPAASDQNRCESLTNDQPLTSHTNDCPLERSRSKPHTVCPKASTILRAISFSAAVRMTGKRTSLPLCLRITLPSTTGLLRASACAYSGPIVYTLTSVPSVCSSSS